MAQPINQKEYLKKYLGIGKKVGDKKKRKKKEKSESTRLKIIDDDVDALISYEITEDLNGETEDAPQIVEIIDERPLSMQTDDKTNTKLWKPIGEADDNIVQDIRKKNRTTSKHFITSYSSQDSSQGENVNKKSEDDYSPPRKHSKRYHSDNDFSPPRRSSNKNHSNDISPPRKTSNRSSTHTNSNEDNSPPRKRAGSQHLNNDMSPPRKQSRDVSSAKRNNDYDNSPPRKKKSVSSRSKNSYNNDNSPPRKKQSCEDYPRKQKKDQREREDCTKRKKSRWNDEEPEASTSKKMDTTLDGKKAGLQNALDLAIETQMIKKKEEEMFKKMSAEVSGVNAATIVRGKRPVNPEEDARQKIKEKENKEKYNKWGRGLKQVEDHNEKVAQELYEMSKPLARYADDEDLEKYLKEQEREGDPMLAYIRKKKHKDAVESGKPTKPIYQGEFMPNRFAIRPGYRWDGVDRSNGYEKKWFNVQNARIADQEESYKWSTEDM